MTLLRNVFGRKKDSEQLSLFHYYQELQERPDHPEILAKQNLEDIMFNGNSEDEVLLYLLEDSIFASLYATFYEQILITVQQNPTLAFKLIERFEADHKEREQMIATQTQYHLNYIQQGGKCPGCPSCENHHDVDELVPFYLNRDTEFFKKLFMGMQSIQFTMDHLLYNIIPNDKRVLGLLTPENILELRSTIFNQNF